MLSAGSPPVGAYVYRNELSRSLAQLGSRLFRLFLFNSICLLGLIPAHSQTVLVGTSSKRSTVDSNIAGQAQAYNYSASATGTVTSLSTYVDSTNGAKTIIVGLYSDSGGHPGSLLTSGTISSPKASSWNSIAVTSASVTQGKQYWLAILGLSGTIQFRDSSSCGSSTSEGSQKTTLTSLPTTWSTGPIWPGSCKVSAYGSSGGSAVGVTISPTSATIAASQTQQFTVTVTGTTNNAVTWSASGGTVSSSGLYTAPATSGAYTVTATSVADTTQSASATVTVTSGVLVTISPATASVKTSATQQFTATVTGSSNKSVTWTATGGSVSTGGLYTAPATAGTYTVTATSAADASKSASATVTVTSAAVSVTISPTSASVLTGATQQFTATVTGSSNASVAWTASAGTISAAGLYTAPATAGTYTVTATSNADTTKSAAAIVTVTSAVQHSVDLTWVPSAWTNPLTYNVYRGTATGGPYSPVATALMLTSFTDNSVGAGNTYYYVTTEVDTVTTLESSYSAEVTVAVPTP